MKQYFTGFFTAFCLTASVFLFMGAQNKNLGDIEADSIILKGGDGRTTIKGGFILTDNSDGKVTSYLGTGEDGIGFLSTFNDAGVQTGFFGTNTENDGMALLWDRYGDAGWIASGKQ